MNSCQPYEDRPKRERIKVKEYSSLKETSENVRRNEACTFVDLLGELIEDTLLHTRVPCGGKNEGLAGEMKKGRAGARSDLQAPFEIYVV